MGKNVDRPQDFSKIFGEEKDCVDKRREQLRIEAGPPPGFTDFGYSALCLSGGGARSAAYCLGVLQALAKARLLKHFDYMSTVSGGGFTGSFLTRWAHEDGIFNVEKRLWDMGEFSKAGEPLHHLRENFSYLAPRIGLLSLDTLSGLMLYLRNLLVNWLIFVPALLLVALLPRWVAEIYMHGPERLGLYSGLIVMWLWLVAMMQSLLRRPSVSGSNGQSDLPFERLVLLYTLPLFISSVILGAQLARSHETVRSLTGLWGNQSQSAGKENAFGVWLYWAAVGSLGIYALIHTFVSARTERNDAIRRKRPQEEVTPELKNEDWPERLEFLLLGLKNLFALMLQAVAFIVAILSASAAIDGYVDIPSDRIRIATTFFPLLFAVSYFLSEVLYNIVRGNEAWAEAEREWTARATAALLVIPLLWAAVSFASFWGREIVQLLLGGSSMSLPAQGVSATVAGLLTFIFSKKTDLNSILEDGKAGWIAIGAKWGFYVVASIFGFLLIGFLGSLAQTLCVSVAAAKNLRGDVAATAILASIFTWVIFVDWFVPFNKFSLHGIYRNRITRTFVGAANPERRERVLRRQPRGFLNMLPGDNVCMWELANDDKVKGPFHIVNLSLNIPGSHDLSSQERKALPFTMSPRHVGSSALRALAGAGKGEIQVGCYRPSVSYAQNKQRLTLGTAVAASGAAFDTQLGRYSHSALRLLATFFNVRLGVWYGNPAYVDTALWTTLRLPMTYKSDGPLQMTLPLMLEFAGLASEQRSYVHLSDGGHFENLAAYEMLKRRCDVVVVVDAGSDGTFEFEDLAALERLANADMGVSLEFTGFEPSKFANTDATVIAGKIHYPEVSGTSSTGEQFKAKTGELLVIKPKVGKSAKPEVYYHKQSEGDFPHDPTTNQFFHESKFFAYLSLGREAGQEAAMWLLQLRANTMDTSRGT